VLIITDYEKNEVRNEADTNKRSLFSHDLIVKHCVVLLLMWNIIPISINEIVGD